MTKHFHYPPELILHICGFVYSSGLQAPSASLDPLVLSNENGVPTALPSSSPSGNWSEPVARRTLANLCLVSHAWNAGAKPWLWRKLEVRLPRSWLRIVEEVVGSYDVPTAKHNAVNIGESIKAAADAVLASSPKDFEHNCALIELEERILKRLNSLDSPVPPELLSPPASRDPSPTRSDVNTQRPDHWELMKTIRNAVQDIVQDNEPGVYVSTPEDPRPGRYVRHVDFNHFRTIGMFRSVDEGNNTRFVTGDRIEAILKEMPNLTTFGATEYMDGALTFTVLKELFLRGAPSRRCARGRGSVVNFRSHAEEEDYERRAECKDIEAVDLTGCVSAAFVNALTEFVNSQILLSSKVDSRGKGRRSHFSRVSNEEPLSIPGLQRLGLRGVKSVPPHILNAFVLAFPSLTHLDLSGTRATPELLAALSQSPTVRLHSLSLARCAMLTGDSIADFLIESPVTSRIQELSLYGDTKHPSPLSKSNLFAIFTRAPCFTRGELTFLDMSSAPLSRHLLVDICKPQPKLRSLGLSYISALELSAVRDFILAKAPNVEVLTLICTSPQLDCRIRTGMMAPTPRRPTRQATLALHSQIIAPLCSPPSSFSIFPTAPSVPPLTRLRVIELSTPMLAGLGSGAMSWRVLKSKGGRGWYVDTASGWVANGKDGSVLKRDLDKNHALRKALNRLADANGNVSSGVGWHARKMEILHGHGMLGREDGLYGAVSFAHQG